jgi:imidazolonepropionase
VMVLEAPTYLHLAYRPGVPLVREVLVGGRPDGLPG